MEKIILDVPKNVRYISEWEEFSLPEYPCIINKQITGCGFTEYCINGPENVILCSPRKILLENKEEQHPGKVLYLRNDLEKVVDVGKDLNKDKEDKSSASIYTQEELDLIKKHISQMKSDAIDHYYNCITSRISCKYFITYDSFWHLKEALGDRIKDFYIVVDEFQSIFTDSRFKSSTEMEFLSHLQGLDRVCFVSATPMMDEYLEMLDEFRGLPYIEMKWDTLDPSRIIKPELSIKTCKSITPIATGIIQTYLDGNFQKFTYQDDSGVFQEIESKELVIYVNSVKNICDIIKKSGLTMENTNVLCANTPENQAKVRKAFGLRSKINVIGSVPKKGGLHKMFTLCTRTVYLGADFYSTCARSLILSDANIECLAVDITLDLPQILGRQRLLDNPWKNRAELYFKTTIKKETFEELKARLNSKKSKTEKLLSVYEKGDPGEKHVLAENYQYIAKSRNYKDDYVAVNTRGGKDLFPVFNNLVMVSELRAYEIQQVDYKDRFSVFNALNDGVTSVSLEKIDNFLIQFDSLTQFTDKMKLLCDNVNQFTKDEFESILNSINIIFKNYFITLGKDRIRSLQYKKSVLETEYERLKNNQENSGSLEEVIYSIFQVGEKYLKSDIKNKLLGVYTKCNIKASPKATDLENYFELKLVDVIDSTGKRTKGFKLISKKL